MDTSQPQDQLAYIENLQRDYLTGSTPRLVSLSLPSTGLRWQRLLAVSRFWKPDTVLLDISLLLRRFLTSVWGSGTRVGYLVVGKARKISVCLGEVFPKSQDLSGFPVSLFSQFGGFFPGAEAERISENWNPVTGYLGVVSGIPSVVGPDDNVGKEAPPNWIARTMQGCQEWGYIVLASPLPVDHPLQLLREATRQRLLIARRNAPTQVSDGIFATPAGGYAEELFNILTRHEERCRSASSIGLWQVQVIFFADSDINRRQLGSTLLGAFGGRQSQPQPLRAHYANSSGDTEIKHYSTDLTSEELACPMAFPSVEMPDFRIKPSAQFDMVSSPAKTPSIILGRIVDADLPQDKEQVSPGSDVSQPSSEFCIGCDELTQHTLICGVTGSGKTNTCFVLLEGLLRGASPTPFLVIEPAKTEYRALHSDSQPVRIFTLGEERIAPFRLNPFWFDTSCGDYSTHIQTHIDHLKAVFNAAFVLYAPMPYVLEMCLHEVYQDKGWNLTSSANTRVSTGHQVPPEAFPTLSDLYAKADEVVDRLGYEQRISMDIKAALQTRIGSLCLGAKGVMLNTHVSIGMDDLLSKPTVIEMENIGNDEEKAFLMGLLLANLYAYRRAQARASAAKGESLNTLQHVTVIEEAHRLLTQVPREQGTEIANIRGHAVSVFASMISEMRAFGEGIVVAEQIPVRLAADVVKNTNLKLMHRLLARDDRDVIGDAMVMTEDQKRFAATLSTGYAVAFHQGEDGPILVRIGKSPHTERKGKVSDGEIKAALPNLPTSLCQQNCGVAQQDHCCDPHVHDRVAPSLSRDVRDAFAGLVIGALESPMWFPIGLTRLNQRLGHAFTVELSEQDALWGCALVHLSLEWFTRMGDGRAWPFDQVRQLADQFCVLTRHTWKDGTASSGPGWDRWRQMFAALCRLDVGPYPGCYYCFEPSRCRYREAVYRLGLTSSNLDRLRSALHCVHQQGAIRAWQETGKVCIHVGQEVCDASPQVVHRLAVCFAVQAGAQLLSGVRSQEALAEYVASGSPEEN